MQMRRLIMTMFCLLPAAALMYGCGSSSKSGGTLSSVATVKESSCRVCHSTSIEPVTGDNILQDYLVSAHNLVPNAAAHYPEGVGCQGCHGGGAQHNGVGPIPYPNPDASTQCLGCHSTYLPAAHRYTMTTAQQDPDAQAPAMYVSKNYENSCSSCHDPHKADKGIGQEHTDWAASAHGDVNGAAWATEDFKENASCIRCHTATGFKNYITSGYTAPTATWATEGDHTRQVLACDACHSSYDYANSVRSAGQYTAPYTDAPTLYPNIGNSNLCIACHTGRVSGDSIVNSTSNFADTSFKNSHYLTAGGTVFSKSGYHYDVRNYDSNISRTGAVQSYPHDNLGVTATGTAAADTYIATNGLGTAGPCVVCHLGSENLGAKTSHTFSPFTEYTAGDVSLNPVCVTCHDTRGAGTNAKVTWFEDSWKLRADAALSALQYQLAVKGIYFSEAYPYFFKDANEDGVLSPDEAIRDNGYKTWELAHGAGTGKATMGAAFNFNLLKHDPGAVAHNRYYTRRLIYDAIDWIDNGILDFSVFATLDALDATVQTYKADAITFLIVDTDSVTAGVQESTTVSEHRY